MERPKLLLPWKHGTILDHVLHAWTTSLIDHVIVIVRRDDEALAEVCRRWPVHLVLPEKDPTDMKASVQIGLQHIQTNLNPAAADRCFIAPADLPHLNVDLINHLLRQPVEPSAITVPHYGKKSGHPAIFPWPLTSDIFQLASNQGIDHLLKTTPIRKVPCSGKPIMDIDTPEDYEKAKRNE